MCAFPSPSCVPTSEIRCQRTNDFPSFANFQPFIHLKHITGEATKVVSDLAIVPCADGGIELASGHGTSTAAPDVGDRTASGPLALLFEQSQGPCPDVLLGPLYREARLSRMAQYLSAFQLGAVLIPVIHRPFYEVLASCHSYATHIRCRPCGSAVLPDEGQAAQIHGIRDCSLNSLCQFVAVRGQRRTNRSRNEALAPCLCHR